jgi:hypothetical protein
MRSRDLVVEDEAECRSDAMGDVKPNIDHFYWVGEEEEDTQEKETDFEEGLPEERTVQLVLRNPIRGNSRELPGLILL